MGAGRVRIPLSPHAAGLNITPTSFNRRGFLAGLLALVSTSALPAAAGVPGAGLSEEMEAERAALIAHFQERVLGSDILEAALTLMEAMQLPRRYITGLQEALAGKDVTHGARSLNALSEDTEVTRALRALSDRAEKDLRLKRKMLRLTRKAPQDEASQQALVEWAITEVAGLELQRIRDHVASYPTEDMVIIFGPVTNYGELGALFLSEPMALFHQLVHGRRARVIYPESPRDYKREVLAALLDPALRVAVFQGHGFWHGFSLQGSYAHPTAALKGLMRKAKETPLELAKSLSGRITGLGIWSGFDRGVLEEEALAELVAQLHPDLSEVGSLKDRVVRYTCGTERYQIDGELIWEVVPESIIKKIYRKPGGFSSEKPEDLGDWESELEAWLADKGVVVKERTALGTCLVPSPSDTLGYGGRSWLDHFVSDPLPAPLPRSAFVGELVVEEEK